MFRASAWACLLPREYRLESCGPGKPPQWAADLIGAAAPRGDVVQIGEADSHLASDAYGCVVLNPSTSARQRLAVSYPHVREFAVVPGMHDPRMFIPLDSNRLAAGAFAIYGPLRRTARIKARAARAAARLGLPGWYRDRVTIALREPGELIESLREVVGQPVIPAISSGSPPPARNRKVTLGLLDPGGNLLAFAKLPGPSDQARLGLENSVRVLRAIAGTPAADCAPRLLFGGPMAGTFAEVTGVVQGQTPGEAFAPAHQHFLNRLATGEHKPAARTEWFSALLNDRALLAARPPLNSILNRLRERMEGLVAPTFIIHGDFAPWNLRRCGGEFRAFDWENASLEGPPLIDRVHYMLSVGYLMHGWTVDEAAQRLADLGREEAGLPGHAVISLQLAYLLHYLLRRFSEGFGDEDAAVHWYGELALRLGADL